MIRLIYGSIVALYLMLFIGKEVDDYDYARFISDEGIVFTSYAENWDEDKLRSLYFLLKQNKHGEEINDLKQVMVQTGTPIVFDVNAAASYNRYTRTIALYQAEDKRFPSDYKYSLAHEYGHHFMYSYLDESKKQTADWVATRGLEDLPVQWEGTTLPYDHTWQPNEILAEDYVQLYGMAYPNSVEKKRTYNLEHYQFDYYFFRDLVPFKHHENLVIPYAGSLPAYIDYLEKKTGIPIDEERKMATPTLSSYVLDEQIPTFTFDVDKKEHLLYQVETFWYNPRTEKVGDFLFVDHKEEDALTFAIPYITRDAFLQYESTDFPMFTLVISMKVVNPMTNFSFFVEPLFFETDLTTITPIAYEKLEKDVQKAFQFGYVNEIYKQLD